ncbi:DUF2332 family protein [Tuberibacillus sp. Marseille-P3662]|uniref:DUF2332 family protein n=1 Tax=Tuberibacillus sp. Marseille-P3662 TaxID=1965358 RepID=UPI000A1CB170|nr:DUF2332 family protein [Tuberibacillus sp. Marseille-P3662]
MQNNNLLKTAYLKDPFLRSSSPPVISRIGLDLHTSDLLDPNDYLWLKSLIWSEHKERRELFKSAAEEVNQHPLKLIEGDGVSLLSNISKEMPESLAVG